MNQSDREFTNRMNTLAVMVYILLWVALLFG